MQVIYGAALHAVEMLKRLGKKLRREKREASIPAPRSLLLTGHVGSKGGAPWDNAGDRDSARSW